MIQRRSQLTRERLTSAARAQFAVGRYEDVTLQMIAREAGRAPSSILRYWSDKGALWREVMGCDPPADSPETRAATALVKAHVATLAGLNALLEAIEGGERRADLVKRVESLIALQGEAEGVAQSAPLVTQSPSDEGSDLYPGATPSRFEPGRPLGPRDIALGANIRRIRLTAGLTLGTVSAALGLSIHQISRYERGLSRVPAAIVPALAQALGCSVGPLLDGVA